LARQQVEEKGGSLAAQQAAAEQAVQANSKDEEEAKNPKWVPFFQVGLVRPTDNQDMSPVWQNGRSCEHCFFCIHDRSPPCPRVSFSFCQFIYGYISTP
jgi:hypothetical protein